MAAAPFRPGDGLGHDGAVVVLDVGAHARALRRSRRAHGLLEAGKGERGPRRPARRARTDPGTTPSRRPETVRYAFHRPAPAQSRGPRSPSGRRPDGGSWCRASMSCHSGRRTTAHHRQEQGPSNGLSGDGQDADAVDGELVPDAAHDPGDGPVVLQISHLGRGVAAGRGIVGDTAPDSPHRRARAWPSGATGWRRRPPWRTGPGTARAVPNSAVPTGTEAAPRPRSRA